ncbi:MAG: coiled-coil domain-containing protein, partial [Spirillospora sp.]
MYGLDGVDRPVVHVIGPVPALAEPQPPRKELTAQQKKLADDAEKLSEQYNGLRVRLQQAQRAAKVSETNAARQKKALDEARARIVRLAADSYKNGPVDPAVAFASAGDPQTVLDKSSTLNDLARQDGGRVAQLPQPMQAAEHARRSAEARTRQVRELTGEAKKKRGEPQAELKKVEAGPGLGPAARTGAGPAVNVAAGGASAKAMGAVRAAMSQRGVPCSGGAAAARPVRPTAPRRAPASGLRLLGTDGLRLRPGRHQPPPLTPAASSPPVPASHRAGSGPATWSSSTATCTTWACTSAAARWCTPRRPATSSRSARFPGARSPEASASPERRTLRRGLHRP